MDVKLDVTINKYTKKKKNEIRLKKGEITCDDK